MSDTWLNLRTALPEQNVTIIGLVTDAAEKLGIPSFIVGATARDIVFAHVFNVRIYRETTDIDFGIAVESWEQFERIRDELTGPEKFRIDRKVYHRLWYGRSAAEMKIDFVPFGKLESPPGQIAFPPDGSFVMTTIGFNEAFQNSVIIKLTERLKIRVVSPAGLAVLKFVSYADKPQIRVRDIQDIWYMMKNYLEIINEERLYHDSDLLNEEDFDLRIVGARLLGRDMQPLLNEQTKPVLLELLSEKENKGLTSLAEIIDRSEGRLGDKLPEIISMLRQLKRGLLERI